MRHYLLLATLLVWSVASYGQLATKTQWGVARSTDSLNETRDGYVLGPGAGRALKALVDAKQPIVTTSTALTPGELVATGNVTATEIHLTGATAAQTAEYKIGAFNGLGVRIAGNWIFRASGQIYTQSAGEIKTDGIFQLNTQNRPSYWNSVGVHLGGNTAATGALQVTGTAGNSLRITNPFTPTGVSDATGGVGQIEWNAGGLVLKTPSGWMETKFSPIGTADPFINALVIVDFNSLGAGRGSSREITSPDDYQPGPFPYTMMNTLATTFPSSTFAKKNFSISGRQTPTMISQAGQVDAMYAPATYDRQVIVAGEITNHIADGNATALAAYNSYVSYCKARRAKGFSVVSTTVINRTTNFASGMSAATFKVRQDSVNALIRANYLQFSDVLADIATLTLTLPDGTHPGDAGYIVMGNYIAAKLTPLLRQGFNPQSLPFLIAGTTPVATNPSSTPSTVLLLRGQGSNNSTTITDEAGHPMTANNTARISTAQFKFGSSSIYLDGGANTHVSTPSSTDFDFGLADFTMEAWLYKTSNGTGFPAIFARGDNTQNQWTLCFPDAGSRLDLYVGNGGTTYTRQNLNHSVDVPLNQWVHIALVSSGGVRRLYQNGTLVGTATTNNSLETNTTGKPLRIGFLPAAGMAQDSGDRFIGYLHTRITKGALYTGSFTPPASF